MNRLYWLYQPGTIPSQELAAGLGSRGFESEWIEMSDDVDARVGALPLEDSVFLLCDDSDDWCVKILKALRACAAPLCHAAVIMVREPGPESIGWLTEAGLDDFLDGHGTEDDLAFRLRLRITQARRRMAQERQLKEHAAANAKSETILKQREEFLGVCAHDLRSPLGVIQSSLTMILGDAGKQSQLSSFHKELLERSKRQAVQAITLVNDLLDVMAHEQGLKPQYQLFNLNDFLGEFYSDYRNQAEAKGVSFHYQNELPSWRVLADADRVRQLLQNLFTNALKFTDAGKNIYLRVEPFKGRRKTDPPYPMIIISLRDEGKGIPESEVQKIFDRFTQVKGAARAQGRGLGLTVAKQISNLHDGNVWVQSEEGKGSTFFALFPHVISEPALGAGTKDLVIVAEPLEGKRELYFSKLAEWGYEPLFVKDGVEALTMLFFRLPKLVILTSGQDKLDEFQVASIAKGDSKTSSIPICLATETGLPPQQKHAKVGFDGCLRLPLTREALQSAFGVTPLKKSA